MLLNSMQIAREDKSLANVSFELEEKLSFWEMFQLGKSLLEFFLMNMMLINIPTVKVP